MWRDMFMDNGAFKLDFIGVGSGKCGSTWFYENIVKHPDFYSDNPKEINYFSDLYTQHDFDWYRSQFKGAKENQLKGEFSVTYMYHPEAARRIYKHFPQVKIIAIVRDPIKRTYSDYLHAIRKGDIPASQPFSEYIKDEKKLKFGHYETYLKQFFDIFPKEQIKIIVLEEFSRDYAKGFREIYEFLGVKNPDFIPPGVEEKRNEARSYRFLLLENIMVRTYRFLAKSGYTRLTELIKRTGIPELMRRLNMSSKPLPAMDTFSKQKLSEYFSNEKRFVSALTGSKLSAWE